MVHTQSPRYSLNSDVVDERVTKDGFWNSLLKLEDPRLQVEGLVVSVALPCLVEYIQHTSTPLKMLAIETIKRGMDWKPLHSAVKRHAATLNILKLPKGADEKCGIFPDRQPTSHCSRPAEASSESQDESGNPGWWPIISTMPVLRSLTVTCLVENVAHMLSVLSIHPSLSVRLKEIRICVPLTPLGWCGTFARRVRQGNQMCMEQYLKAVLAWEVPTSGRAWNEIVVVGSTDPKFYIKRAVRVATKMMREEDMDDIKEVANEDVG